VPGYGIINSAYFAINYSSTVVEIPFLKKITIPRFDFLMRPEKPSYVGIDIGSEAAKVVQLRKEQERAILETYGELKTAQYFKHISGSGGGFLRFLDQDVADMLKDLLAESNATTRQAVIGIPATSSFITAIDLPLMAKEDVGNAVSFEARRYVPIPMSEVTMDWEIIEEDETAKKLKVLIAVVPNEVVNKYKRISELARLEIKAIEIESFAMTRSLISRGKGVTAIVNLGAHTTTVIIADNRIIKHNSNIGRGSREITLVLARSLAIEEERAELVKKEVGLSTKPEEKDIADIITPIVDAIFSEVERVMSVYNRANIRKVERIIISGGGAAMAGLIDYITKRTGLEAALSNPFALTVYPTFMQPILRDIGPEFAVAVGLALRQITSR